MFADLFNHQRPAANYEQAFVEAGDVRLITAPDPKVERLILVCWILIAIKHVAVIWAVYHYHIPFHQLWVNAPTWLLAAVATGLYYYYHRRPLFPAIRTPHGETRPHNPAEPTRDRR